MEILSPWTIITKAVEFGTAPFRKLQEAQLFLWIKKALEICWQKWNCRIALFYSILYFIISFIFVCYRLFWYVIVLFSYVIVCFRILLLVSFSYFIIGFIFVFYDSFGFRISSLILFAYFIICFIFVFYL